MKTGNVRGMTMIELIMTIAIGAFVVSGIVLFTKQLTFNAMDMQNRIHATDVARLEAERVMRSEFDDVVDGTFDLNGFRVRRQVQTAARSNQQARDDNDLDTGLVDPGWVMIRQELSQVSIEVDEPGGDFSDPLVQLFTFKQSHVVE